MLGKLLSVIFLFLGFLVSIEAFSEWRVPFTRIVLLRRRAEPAGGHGDEARYLTPPADATLRR